MTTVTGKRVILKNLQDEYLIPFTDQGGSGNPDNETIILNDEDALRAIKVMDQGQEEPYAFREVTAQEYAAMKQAGTLDPHTYYNVPDVDDIIVDVNSKANRSLDNLNEAGQAIINGKANTSLTNLTAAGEIKLTQGRRNIGEIVTSSLPLTDAGLHLLDGSLIQMGVYSEFVEYMANLYGDGTNIPSYFCSENEWQASVTQYGVCGKFVYDSTNNTVRLPKVTGIVEGTTDLTALGDLVQAGLPDPLIDIVYREDSTSSGVYTDKYGTNGYTGTSYTDTSGTDEYMQSSLDKGASAPFGAVCTNPIYGNSSTVQPQTIKVLYYIVIATSSKTDIQVDIDEIATDLNGKADTDLENTTTKLADSFLSKIMPDYENGITVTNVRDWIQVTKHSIVMSAGSDPYAEDYKVYVSPDKVNLYPVGVRYDDTNGNTQVTSFYFLVPKGWYFINYAEHATTDSEHRIYPLKGAQ